MEAHTASKLFQRSGKMGLNYSTLIGDDDSSTLAKLRAEVNPDIIKISDPTHTNRTLHGKLKATRQLQSQVTVRELTSIETRQKVGLAIGWIDIHGFARNAI